MTTPIQTPIVELVGNGVTLSFAYPYLVQDATHMDVYLNEILQGAGYSVLGVGNPAGGSVDFLVAPANGVKVLLRRDVPLSQLVDYVPYDPFPAESHEQSLDKLTQQIQDMRVVLSGTVRLSDAVLPGVALIIPSVAARASGLLGFDAAGNLLITAGSGSVAISVAMTPVVQAASLSAGRLALGIPNGIAGQALSASNAAGGLVYIDNPSRPNLLINPNWQIDQINEGALYTYSASSAVGPDGWSGVAAGAGTFKVRTLVDPDNAQLKCLEITCTVADAAIAASDRYSIYTAIEGYDVSTLLFGSGAAKALTVQFKFKTNVTGVYGIAILNGAGSRFYPSFIEVLNTNENEYSVTLTGDTGAPWLFTNGIGLILQITLSAGSTFQGAANVWTGIGSPLTTAAQCNFMSAITNVAYLKRIQLIPGALVQEYRPTDIQSELAKAQRYLTFVHFSANQRIATGQAYSTNAAMVPIQFPVQMRAPPSVSVNSVGAFDLTSANATRLTVTGISQNAVSITASTLDISVASGLVAGDATHLTDDASDTGTLHFNARLS